MVGGLVQLQVPLEDLVYRKQNRLFYQTDVSVLKVYMKFLLKFSEGLNFLSVSVN